MIYLKKISKTCFIRRQSYNKKHFNLNSADKHSVLYQMPSFMHNVWWSQTEFIWFWPHGYVCVYVGSSCIENMPTFSAITTSVCVCWRLLTREGWISCSVPAGVWTIEFSLARSAMCCCQCSSGQSSSEVVVVKLMTQMPIIKQDNKNPFRIYFKLRRSTTYVKWTESQLFCQKKNQHSKKDWVDFDLCWVNFGQKSQPRNWYENNPALGNLFCPIFTQHG